LVVLANVAVFVVSRIPEEFFGVLGVLELPEHFKVGHVEVLERKNVDNCLADGTSPVIAQSLLQAFRVKEVSQVNASLEVIQGVCRAEGLFVIPHARLVTRQKYNELPRKERHEAQEALGLGTKR
jgi:hypothetical protein